MIRRACPRLFAVFVAFAVFAVTPVPIQAADADAEDGFVSLFDGKTLTGWRNPYDWGEVTIVDGEIRLKANKKFFLTTEKTYGDFILEGEIKVPEGKSNSGFMFRCHVEKNRVYGYQAEVDPSDRKWAGGLYDEGRRAWLHPLTDDPQAQAAFKPAEWNKYRIECVGDHIQIYVNGVLTTDYIDSMDLVGPVGIQHHGEVGQVYRFRNLRIKELGRHQWKPIFDGKTLGGWRATPGGEWKVENSAIVGTSPSSEPRHGFLVYDKPLKDFTIRLKFQVNKGDSGFYFRSQKVDGPDGLHGLQAQISAGDDVGGIYEMGGRGWVVKPQLKPEDAKKQRGKPGQWSELTVSAHGKRIVIDVNGVKTAESREDSGRGEGIVALQLHGGQDLKVMFKDVEILE